MNDHFSIFGFKIEKATSFTSLAAFILAMWGATSATLSYIQGPKPELIQPEAIVAYKDHCEHQGFPTVGFVVRVSVFNSAPKDYASVLHDFRIRFTGGAPENKEFEFYAEKFATFGDSSPNKKGRVGCENADYKDAIYYVDAKNFTNEVLVEGSSLFSSELLFLPYVPPCKSGEMKCYTKNYLSYEKFIELVKNKSESTDPVSFSLHILHDLTKSQKKTCTINTNNAVVSALETYLHFDVNCAERLTL